MKLKFILPLVIVFACTTGAYAQVEDSTAPPADLPDAVEAPAAEPSAATPNGAVGITPITHTTSKATTPPVRRPAPVADTIKGNARNDVAFVPMKGGSCGNGMEGLSITNKHTSRTMMVRVDVSVMYNGRISKKSTLIDNLSPKEVRAVGCSGCIDKPTGKACTTYKIIAAQFKN
jgi:hypothetical protein